MIQFWRAYVSKGLVQPPTSNIFVWIWLKGFANFLMYFIGIRQAGILWIGGCPKDAGSQCYWVRCRSKSYSLLMGLHHPGHHWLKPIVGAHWRGRFFLCLLQVSKKMQYSWKVLACVVARQDKSNYLNRPLELYLQTQTWNFRKTNSRLL